MGKKKEKKDAKQQTQKRPCEQKKENKKDIDDFLFLWLGPLLQSDGRLFFFPFVWPVVALSPLGLLSSSPVSAASPNGHRPIPFFVTHEKKKRQFFTPGNKRKGSSQCRSVFLFGAAVFGGQKQGRVFFCFAFTKSRLTAARRNGGHEKGHGGPKRLIGDPKGRSEIDLSFRNFFGLLAKKSVHRDRWTRHQRWFKKPQEEVVDAASPLRARAGRQGPRKGRRRAFFS